MTKYNLLQNYIEIVDSTTASDEFKAAFKEFVESYDGTETKELHSFLILLSTLLLDLETVKVSAEAYSKLKEVDEEIEKEMKELAQKVQEENEEVFEPPILA